MARIYSTGFEMGGPTDDTEFTVSNGPAISTTTVHGGVYAMRITSLSSGASKNVQCYISSSNTNGAYYVRFFLRVATAPNANNIICSFINASGLQILRLYLNTDRTLNLRDEDGNIGSSSALATGQWYRVEVKFDRTPSAGSHAAELRIDGSTAATSSSLNWSTGIRFIAFGGNIGSEANSAGDWFFDDIAINDTTGSAQTSWPGDGKIIHLTPNASGNNNQWTDSDGGSGTNNWTYINTPIDPSDGTYLLYSSFSNLIDDYNITSPSAIDSYDTVTLVQVGCRTRGGGFGSGTYLGKLRIKSASSGTVTSSAAFAFNAPFGSAWLTNGSQGNLVRNYRLTSYTDPTTGVAWTPTGTNSLTNAQIGFTNNAGVDDDLYVSSLWALVEYVDGTAPAPGIGFFMPGIF